MLSENGMCQSAMLVDGLVPAVAKKPPMTSSDPVEAIPRTAALPYCSFTPVPKLDQPTPSHFAIWLAETTPAEEKKPPTYKSFRSATKAYTFPAASIPPPIGHQFVPSHRAMFVAPASPANRKLPPA